MAKTTSAVTSNANRGSSGIIKTSEQRKSHSMKKTITKLGQLVGEDLQFATGELRNEEGLPIIDINEPMAVEAATYSNSLSAEDLPLQSLSSLSPETREVWRKQRDYILDRLEEEERGELVSQKRQVEVSRVEKEDMIEHRLKQANELQKKMGKAIFHHSGMKERQGLHLDNTITKPNITSEGKSSPKKRKSVSFLEPTDRAETPSTSALEDFGDISLARLRSTGPSVLSGATPMKDLVVERVPNTMLSDNKLSDSDDESNAESTFEELNEYSLSNDELSSIKDSSSDEDCHFDSIQHQREISLDYYKKRNKFRDVFFPSQSSSVGRPSQYSEFPPDMTTSQAGTPATPLFRESSLASSYGADMPRSKTPGSPFIHPSAFPVLQNELCMGKLDASGKLTGGQNDDKSDNEVEAMREAIEVIRKGEMRNLGPDGDKISGITPFKAVMKETIGDINCPNRTFDSPLPIKKPKASLFKARRSSSVPFSPATLTVISDRNDCSGRTQASRCPPAVTSSVIERTSSSLGSDDRKEGPFFLSTAKSSPANLLDQSSTKVIETPEQSASEVLYEEPVRLRLTKPPVVLSSAGLELPHPALSASQLIPSGLSSGASCEPG